jgi:hypothetical protein
VKSRSPELHVRGILNSLDYLHNALSVHISRLDEIENNQKNDKGVQVFMKIA